MRRLTVSLGERSYPIGFAPGDWVSLLRERWSGSRLVFLADTNTQTHAHALMEKSPLPTQLLLVPAGEPSKSLDQTAQLYRALARLPADRHTLLVAVGGGVVGDLTGFVAATYNRGLPLMMVPTSLLAMVDSSVGGKVGINLPEGKNLVGAFHQPCLVWIDIRQLATLPEREYRSGLAEVVKYGVILDADFFAWLAGNVEAILAREPHAVEHLVARSCELKAQVVQQDEYERTGLRAILNYGHTFAHAFETVAGYGSWLHGEAVALGMHCAARLAARRGLIPPALVERQQELLLRFGLPCAPDPAWPVDALLAAMRTDKKAVAGQLRFVLPTRLGEVRLFADVRENEVRAALG
jgi:3-dehydroquinate synthase